MDKSQPSPRQATRANAAPTSDPTNPYNQKAAGDWTANERAAERKNIEPGLTDKERRQRRW